MAREWIKGLVCILLLTGLVVTVLPIQAWRIDTPVRETMPGIANALFRDWVFAFELLSVLLLAALLGALFLGHKQRRGEEDQP